MNLKIIALMMLVIDTLIVNAHGMVLRVSLSSSNGCPTYAVNDRGVTRASLTNLLGKLGGLDKDQCIYVMVDRQVSALSLVSAISDIQNTGLHTLVVICPAVENGKQGTYQLSIDATKRLVCIGCCGGSGVESGFHENIEDNLLQVDETLRKELLKDEAGGDDVARDMVSPSSPDSGSTATKTFTRKMLTSNHLYTVSGALPIKEEASVFYYRAKCRQCGNEAKKTEELTLPVKESSITSDYTCPDCGNKQTIRIEVEKRAGKQTNH